MAYQKILGALSLSDLEAMVNEVKKQFTRRDEKWEDRRRVRFRRMEDELYSLPLSERAGGKKALMIFQDEEPNQETHRRVKRLVSNKPRFECIIYDSTDEQKQMAQDVKDAVKSLYKMMNRGKVSPEILCTEYQQGDGCGLFKIDLDIFYADDVLSNYDPDVLESKPGKNESDDQTAARKAYADAKESLRGEMNDDGSPKYQEGVDLEPAAYKKATDKARSRLNSPVRLSAPDPLTAFWTMDGDQIDFIVESGKRSLSALLTALKTYNVRLIDEQGIKKLYVYAGDTPVGEPFSGDTIPENEQIDRTKYNTVVDYTEIRTRTEVVLIIKHPQLLAAADKKNNARRRGKADDGIVISFENPFGPYSTGYVLVPGDITGSHDPADMFQPPILGTLNLAQPLNVLRTIRISAAIDKALAPPYIATKDAAPAPTLNTAQTDKTPSVKDGKPVPQIQGEVKRMDSANIDLDKAEQEFTAIQQKYLFNEVLAGDATSADSGHKLAIQVSQADTQLVPYQNARAQALTEVMMAVLWAVKKLGQPLYIRMLPDTDGVFTRRISPEGRIKAILPEMFDLDFELIVTIGSETPVTKFAKWSALEQRYKAGTLSYETLMEQSDIENVGDEIARVFEGQTLVAVMQQSIPVVVQMIAHKQLAKIMGPPPGQGGAPGQQQPVEQGGAENGGGMPGAEESGGVGMAGAMGRMPGAGMSPAGPTTRDFGGTVHTGAGEVGGSS